MPVIPGGKIIGGMGGRIYTGPIGSDIAYFEVRSAEEQIEGISASDGDPGYLEVEQWTISRQWINAECTHSGTYGAITRRSVAFDWQFQCSLPADQDNLPDRIFGFNGVEDGPEFVNTAIAFFLGDVKINVEAVAMDMEQRFYFAPMCIVRSIQPVLSAARDVIRYHVSGEGNSRLWLIPDETESCGKYLTYLESRGWIG
jgi:hypothetical protein